MSAIAPFRDGMVLTVPNRLSYSQVSKYSECGNRYRLEYGRGIKGGSWFATVAGKVLHEITEIRDMNRLIAEGLVEGEVQEVPEFEPMFRAAVAEEQAKGVELKPSGKEQETVSLYGGPNKKDLDWWLIFGPLFLELYERWRDGSEWQIAFVEVDGVQVPAIELEFKLTIGEEAVVGYVDRVFWDPAINEYIIVDLKTGALPVGKLQLGDYRVGLLEQYGIDCPYGVYFYMAQRKPQTTEVDEPQLAEDGSPVLFKSGPRKGQPKTKKVKTIVPAEPEGRITAPVSLHAWSREFMEARYAMARRGVMAGVFMPNVTMLCKGCGVRRYCAAVGGDRAVLVPHEELFITQREPKKEELIVEEDLTAE